MPTIENRFIEFKDEGAFGEQLSTMDFRLAVIDCTLPQPVSDRRTDRSVKSRFDGARAGWQLPRTGSFSVEFYIGGAQVDTASGGLVSLGGYKLLADAFGGGDLSQVGGVAGSGASATSMPNATGTRTRGAISRVGILGDGRAGGQPVVWGNPNTGTLVAMPGTPNAGDVIRACKMIYLTETPGPTKRFLVSFSEDPANHTYVAHGCQCSGIEIMEEFGTHMRARLTYQYVNARRITGYTSALTMDQNDCAMSAAGSFHLQTVGTTTRALEETRGALEIVFNIGLVPITGPAGVNPYQPVVGWRRIMTDPEVIGTLRLTLPPSTTKPADWVLDGNATLYKNALFQNSTGQGTAATEGRHVSMFWASLFPWGPEPMLDGWGGGVPSQVVTYAFRGGPDTTNDLTQSAFRMGLS